MNRRFYFFLWLALISSSPLCAAPSDQAPLIQVHPDKNKSAGKWRIEAQEKLRHSAGNVQLLDQTNWDNQRAATIKDITDYIPSIITQPRNGAESSRLSMRGSGLANTFQGRGLLILQDGIPVTMTDGTFEFPVIDPWLTDFVEVYPGANALQYGSSTLGGALNFVTHTALSDPGIDIRGEVGSFATGHEYISAGKILNNYDIFASASNFEQSGFRDNNHQTTTRLNANAGMKINEDLSDRFYISNIKSRAEIPGAISLFSINADPSQANPANALRHYQRDLDITRLANNAIWHNGPSKFETNLFYIYRTLDNPVTTYEFQDSNDLGLTSKYTYDFGLDKIITGANVYYGFADEDRYRNNFASPGAFILNRNLYAFTSEAFAQYEKNIAGPLYGLIGDQLSYTTRDIKQHTPDLSSQNKNYVGMSPKIGLRYEIDPETQLFSNLSKSFEPPTWGELSGGNAPGFNDLKAQRATTFEIGGKGRSYKIDWNAAYYHSWLRDEFVNYRFEDGSSDTINADKTKHDGIELGANGTLLKDVWTKGDSISGRAAYNWNHFNLDHDSLYGNNQLPGVPEHFFRAETLYHHISGFSVGPNVEWTPDGYPIDLTNSLKTKSYAIFGGRAFWDNPAKTLSFYVEARNIFDRKYIATSNVIPDAAGLDGNYFYPGEGRALYTGIEIKF